MRGPYQILLPLLGLFFCRVDLTDFYPLRMKVRLIRIYDGDTVLLGRGNYRFKLRISRIDSPEKGQPTFSPKIDGGQFARHCLEGILKKEKELVVKITGIDIYKRYLGDLNEVSFMMIKRGCAGLYPLASFRDRGEMHDYLKALKSARDQRRGLYRYGGFMQPRKWRKLSKRFAHRP